MTQEKMLSVMGCERSVIIITPIRLSYLVYGTLSIETDLIALLHKSQGLFVFHNYNIFFIRQTLLIRVIIKRYSAPLGISRVLWDVCHPAQAQPAMPESASAVSPPLLCFFLLRIISTAAGPHVSRRWSDVNWWPFGAPLTLSLVQIFVLLLQSEILF